MQLAQVESRRRWVLGGLALQVFGVGLPVVYVVGTAHRQSIGGHLTAATVRLAWRHDVHTAGGLTLLVIGTTVFAAGSVAMARPFVRRRTALFVAVPLAAVVGMLVLGVVAVLVAAVVAGGWDSLDFDLPWPFRRRKRRGAA